MNPQRPEPALSAYSSDPPCEPRSSLLAPGFTCICTLAALGVPGYVCICLMNPGSWLARVNTAAAFRAEETPGQVAE
jgi:hypothetical protein